MSEAECLIDVLVSVLRKYHPHSPLCDSHMRHWSDIDTLELLHERVLHLCLDMGSRGTFSQFWSQIELALRPIRNKRIDWDELPRSIDKACCEPVRGEFTGEAWGGEVLLADEVLRCNKYKPPIDGKGVSRRMESPHTFRYERRSLGE